MTTAQTKRLSYLRGTRDAAIALKAWTPEHETELASLAEMTPAEAMTQTERLAAIRAILVEAHKRTPFALTPGEIADLDALARGYSGAGSTTRKIDITESKYF